VRTLSRVAAVTCVSEQMAQQVDIAVRPGMLPGGLHHHGAGIFLPGESQCGVLVDLQSDCGQLRPAAAAVMVGLDVHGGTGPAPQEGDMELADTNRFADGCAWIEGRYVPIADARIPILDTGFTRSDCTYDVAAVWKGRFFRLDDHIDRLLGGCARIRLTPPVGKEEIRSIMVETVRRSGLRDAYVEAVVTRGVPRPGERDPRVWTARLYAYAIPYVWIVRPELQDNGTVNLVVARNTRRIPAGSVDPTVKNFHWGDMTRGLYEAYDRGGSLAVLPDADGFVTEGPGFNVFAVTGSELYTPARGVLAGITRRTVLEIAEKSGITAHVTDLPVGDLYRAAEVFLTSTAGGVMPVTRLDGHPVGDGRTGPVTRRIKDQYWDLHQDPALSFAVDYPPTA
jgi:branched-chain amino acid aminotransferase